jgi:hypothetical protein
MDVIDQRLIVQDWPLTKPGDEKFFGYVVAMGVFPRDWSSEGMIRFVDFAYNNDYTRYHLPNDIGLMRRLQLFLCDNIEMEAAGYGAYGKVWIKRTGDGYEVDLP